MPRIPQKQVHQTWQPKTKGEDRPSAMAKRRAETPQHELMSDDAEGGIGTETLPNVPENFVPNQHQYGTTVRSIKSSGTFWLNNVNSEGLFGSNLWHEFPWEFVQVHMDELLAQELYSKYKLWKPLTCTVSFSNPNMFIDTSTDTNPLMTETTQGEVTSLVDHSWQNSAASSAIWGRASNNAAADTVTETSNIIQSWKANGYTSNSGTDTIQFLPTQAEDFTNINYIRANYPDSHLIGVGNGQKTTHTWHYKPHYWRYTNEFTAPAIFTIPEYIGPVNLRPHGRRTDYLAGTIYPSALASTQIVQTGGSVAAATNAPFTNSGAQGTVFQADVTRAQTFCDPDPQPPLLLHLKPHAQAFTGVGQTVCQLDFEITYELLFKNEAPRIGRSLASVSTGVNVGINPTLFGPAFLPWVVSTVGI